MFKIFWRDPVSISSLFPSCPALFGVGVGGGQDRITLCVLEPFFFEMFHLLLFLSLIFFLIFFFIVLRCETVSPSGRSTHSVREKRVTFNSKTSSGNINHVINEKKCTSFNLFIYTFYTSVVITLGVFLLFLF